MRGSPNTRSKSSNPEGGLALGRVQGRDAVAPLCSDVDPKPPERAFCGRHADLVVSHGQTIFHWVEGDRAPGSLQLGQPAWIADLNNSPVVSDLRSRDTAAGGQGAPLASIFDVLLLGSGERRWAALNLGGIANITLGCSPLVLPDPAPRAPGHLRIEASVPEV